jgi:hypothetical protein
MNNTAIPTATVRPSLETMAGLYNAASEHIEAAERALNHVESVAKKHGYTIEEVACAAAMKVPEKGIALFLSGKNKTGAHVGSREC